MVIAIVIEMCIKCLKGTNFRRAPPGQEKKSRLQKSLASRRAIGQKKRTCSFNAIFRQDKRRHEADQENQTVTPGPPNPITTPHDHTPHPLKRYIPHDHTMIRFGIHEIASGKTISAAGHMYGFAGKLNLIADGTVQSIGSLSDGTVVEGKWTPSCVSFRLLHNGCLYYDYSLEVTEATADGIGVKLRGTWKLGVERMTYGAASDVDSERGEIQFSLRPVEGGSTRDGEVPTALGESVCEIKPMEQVEVPCMMCGLGDSGQLTFFEMKIPHFGLSE